MNAASVLELVEAHRSSGSTVGYPATVRSAVAEFARGERNHGQTWRQISAQVGVSSTTVRTWMLSEPVPSGFVPVVVGEESEPQAAAKSASRGLVLTSPNGFAVEGLQLDQAIAALRALG